MFSVLGRLVGYLLGSQDEDDEARESPSLEEYHQQLPWLLDVDNHNTSSYKTRCFEGKVTHIFSDQGLIDGEIYFSFSVLSAGSGDPKVGDMVHVIAEQQHENGGWHASSVTITVKSWEDEEEDSSNDDNKLAFIGKVTHIRDGTGFIDQNIEFDIEDCLNDYRPEKGDWVTARIEREIQEEETKKYKEEECEKESEEETGKYAVDIEPLRSWTFEGNISAAMQDHGYIDGEVYFSQSACLNGYRPSKWDPVKVTAIESQQGKCSWRAVNIVRRSTNREQPRMFNNAQTRSSQYNDDHGWLIPGQKPKLFRSKMKLPNNLPQYPINNSLRNCVLDQGELTLIAPHLAENLCLENYVQRFSTLLHLEEIQQELDIQEFDMTRVCLRNSGQYLALIVPGLAEGRPSVMIGDKILLSSPVDPDGPRYEGFVHEVTTNEVLLKFNPDFHSRYGGEDYNVKFTFTRTTLRRCHLAVRLAVKHLTDTVLFPSSLNMKTPQLDLNKACCDMNTVKFPNSYNGSARRQNINLPSSSYQTKVKSSQSPSNKSPQKSIPGCGMQTSGTTYMSGVNSWIQDRVSFINPCLNDRQKTAVIKILLGQSRPLPYVIFGPPGTGKTITVVESILQVFSQVQSSRILACTPSNSAADLLAERLVKSGLVKTSDMVRLNAFQRSDEGIPESVIRYCNVGTDLALMSKYRIVVCTCVTAGSFYILGLTAGHFTHVFVDECGQATEPECLIPMGLVSGADGQIILAGDPRQLGPVLMSKYAKMFGLDQSFLERLMSNPLYTRNLSSFTDNGGFDSLVVTMLVDNYRSHQAILSLPSRLFYYDELKECADPGLTSMFCGWNKLPTKDFPVIFHGVKGEDIRDGGSPSWYNPMETLLVVQYLQALLQNGPFDIDTDDIGIITPYRKQVEKIRLLIDKLDVPRVKVGSVEEFQGQERQVIIISTVRSSSKLVGFDLRHTLGFLSNAKRFNVSITRAQALLIVVGDPHTLARDPYWLELIKYCEDNGAYVGCDLPSLDKQDDDDDMNSTERVSSCTPTVAENTKQKDNHTPVTNTRETRDTSINKTLLTLKIGDHVNNERGGVHTLSDRHTNTHSSQCLDLINRNEVLNAIHANREKLGDNGLHMTSGGDCSFSASGSESGDVMTNIEVADILKGPLASLNDGSLVVPNDAVWCSDIEYILQKN